MKKNQKLILKTIFMGFMVISCADNDAIKLNYSDELIKKNEIELLKKEKPKTLVDNVVIQESTIIENSNNKKLVIIDKVAAWLILNLVNAVSYINNGNVVVAFDGPPFVINHIMSNILNDSNVPTNPNTNRTLLRFGNVMKKNCWIKLAPSTLDASYISLFMEFSPDRIINAKKGLHLHELIRTKLMKALFGELKKPVASSNKPISIKTEFITPLLLLSINFQITTTTTVGIINDKIIQLAIIFLPGNL